ncbi:MAG: 2-amino-4-hydroxy-6-hydroxymethyldihydropteridine diphosphokinase, partial [Spirochaetota bacterium]
AIGSNIEPKQNIKHCLELLKKLPEFTLTQVSSWYKTRPWGIEDQAFFLNIVVGGKTALSPHELLQETQEIEHILGRKHTIKNGPRSIDLDLLLYGEQMIQEADLVIPHMGLLKRDFMLVPLIEIAPSVIHPTLQKPVKELTHFLQYNEIISIESKVDARYLFR